MIPTDFKTLVSLILTTFVLANRYISFLKTLSYSTHKKKSFWSFESHKKGHRVHFLTNLNPADAAAIPVTCSIREPLIMRVAKKNEEKITR